MIASLLALLMAGGGVSPNTVTVSYIGGTNNGTSGTSFTFTNHAIGTANANRRVVVVAYPNGSSSVSTTGITIGGNAATINVAANNITNASLAIASLPVASGTTATIVVSTSATAARCRIEVYSVTGDVSIPTLLDSGSNYAPSNNAPSTVNLNVAAGAGVVGGLGTDGTDRTFSWTNVTKDNEQNTGTTTRDMSVASVNVASGSTLAVTATPNGITTFVLAAASYR